MKLWGKTQKNFSLWILLLVSIIFISLRFPSLLEPYWYGDEGVYQAVAMLINSGEKLYSGAWENKPPLLLVTYALMGSDQFLIRTLSLVFGLISVWVFYFIAKKLFNENKYAYVTSTLFYSIVFGTIIIEGNIANAENFMLLPILLGAWLILYVDKIKDSLHFKSYFLAGFLMSLAFLTKIVAVFDFLAFSFFLYIDSENNFKQKFKKKLLPFFLGFTLPVLMTIAYFLLTNNFRDFMDAFLLKNVGYVGVENKFIIPQGLLIFKSLLLGAFVLFIFWKRNKINKSILFVLIWLAFSLFSVFFSQRPYNHYLIMLLPSFSLLIGAIIYAKKERFLLLILLILTYIIVSRTFELKTQFSKYYSNFVDYNLGRKSTYEYISSFDRRAVLDYQLANYIKNNTSSDDSVFIWGNNAQVYKLANKTPLARYTVAYHITFFPLGVSDMKKGIEEKKPKLIIIMPNVPDFPLSLENYSEKIDIQGARIYEKIL